MAAFAACSPFLINLTTAVQRISIRPGKLKQLDNVQNGEVRKSSLVVKGCGFLCVRYLEEILY